MRIVHTSDWHSFPRQLPEADLYVFTGDMLDNYPVVDKSKGSPTYRHWRIDPTHEWEMQTRAMDQFYENGGIVRYLGTPDAPVVCVRGNHDFVDLKPFFKGVPYVHEFVNNEIVVFAGVTITGHRGVPYIDGNWNDEETRADLMDRLRAMPSADIYVTHYPPAKVLDGGYGLAGMADNLLYRGTKALHCFGHIHEEGGQTKRLATVTFSNAACNVNVIDWNL